MPTYDSWKQFDEGVNVIDIELEKWLSQEWRNFFEKEIKRLVKYPSDKNDVYSVFEADLNKFFYNCYDVEYKEQSQMHVNTINGANLSSHGCKMMRMIYKSVNEDDEPIEMEEQKPKTKRFVKN